MDNISFVYIDKIPGMKLISYTDVTNESLEAALVEKPIFERQIA